MQLFISSILIFYVCRDEEKFDCITVSYAPIKAYVDYLISEVEGVMIRCLQQSITSSASSVQQFLNEATNVLTQNPQSIEDITLATRKHEEFLTKRTDVSTWNIRFLELKHVWR